ncbi:MAG: ATP-dependent Clp protease proteolytic subunit, partial [Synergistaceae bacterium]|nr:ATP-dependent Clp protease proteolytic subunit [Synergistaceae bacterium]
HQPLGGARGQASDIEIQAKNIIKTKERMNRILSSHTGKDYKTVARDTDRDNYMTADEALKYGLIDKIIEAR